MSFLRVNNTSAGFIIIFFQDIKDDFEVKLDLRRKNNMYI